MTLAIGVAIGIVVGIAVGVPAGILWTILACGRVVFGGKQR